MKPPGKSLIALGVSLAAAPPAYCDVKFCGIIETKLWGLWYNYTGCPRKKNPSLSEGFFFWDALYGTFVTPEFFTKEKKVSINLTITSMHAGID